MTTAETGTSLELRTQQVVDTLHDPDFLEQVKETLPENVNLEKFVRVATTAIRSTPDLVKADETSLFGSIVKCAQDGLLPDGREAALVIYGNKVQYLPMIGGFRKIAADHGWTITTQTVRDGDVFDFEEGLEPKLVHKRAKPGDRGDLVNAYAIAQHRDGRKVFVVLDEAEIDKCREVSRAKSNGPWVQWTERMWEKTAGKRLFKQLPISDRELVERVLAADLVPAGSTAAALLYGRADVPAVEPPAGEPENSINGGAGQQAGPAGDSAAPAPGSDIEEGDFEVVEESPLGEITAEEFAAAAATKFSGGAWDKKTFAQVAEAGEDGHTYLLVQLKRSDIDQGVGRKLAVFVHEQLPDVWQQYIAWKAAQS